MFPVRLSCERECPNAPFDDAVEFGSDTSPAAIDLARYGRQLITHINRWKKKQESRINFTVVYAFCKISSHYFIYVTVNDSNYAEGREYSKAKHEDLRNFIRGQENYQHASHLDDWRFS